MIAALTAPPPEALVRQPEPPLLPAGLCPRHILHGGHSPEPCGDLDVATIREEHTHAAAAGIIASMHGDGHTARLAAFALAVAAQLRGEHARAEKAAADLDTNHAAIRALLLARVGRCFHGIDPDPEMNDANRCPEPAVYGILTGWACWKHRQPDHRVIIGGAATKLALRALGMDL